MLTKVRTRLCTAAPLLMLAGPTLAADAVVPTIPEPGTLGLMAAGVGAAALIARHRRKK